MSLDIAAIARRTGLPPRRLRYTLDHGVLPGAQRLSRGRGAARSFTEFEAFGLAVAALMLEAGLRRKLVRDCLHLLAGRYSRATAVEEIPLYQAFEERQAAYLDVGDGVNVRLSGAGGGPRRAFDTGWQQAATGAALAAAYEPLVLVRLNTAALRRQLEA